MITVIIRHDGEDNVIKLTYENLWRELKDIQGAQLLVAPNWFDDLPQVKNKFVCFVEADCLVSSGYFTSQLGLLKKNENNRRIGIMSSSTAVRVWANRFYGYDVRSKHTDGVMPNREKRGSMPYALQVAYIPGALIRMTTLNKLLELKDEAPSWEENLVTLSANLSLNFWSQGVGNGIGMMAFINPNTTYVTTENYVNDITKFKPEVEDMDMLREMFRKQEV